MLRTSPSRALRHRWHLRDLAVLTLAISTLFVLSHFIPERMPAGDSSAASLVNSSGLQRSLYFIENQGQLAEEIAYYTHDSATQTFFTSTGIYFTAAAEQQGESGTWTTAIDFVDGNKVRPIATQAGTGLINYFKGSEDEWHTGIPTATELRYTNVWSGIDLIIEAENQSLKYTFVVAPGANPDLIKLAYKGATLKVENGNLIAETPGATYVDKAPVSYQEVAGEQTTVPVQFSLLNESDVTFEVGTYDPTLPLIIDPIVVTYASYLGGAALDDIGGGPQIDAGGNLYIAGRTKSADAFTGALDPGFDATYGGGALFDGYVAKYAPDGASLLWGAYVGGTKDDNVFGMTIDADGDVYVTGTTHSKSSFQVPDEGFPATLGAFDTTYNSTTEQDSFVCKIDTDGQSVHFCSYLGGTDGDFGFEIAVDSLERAYVVGMTASSPANGFPVLVGPDVSFNGGAATDSDAFITRFNATGTALEYSGYIGGDDGVAVEEFREEEINSITVDGSFNAYVSGLTTSTQTTFPDGDGFGAVPGYDQTHAGLRDGFIAKVDPSGATLLGATYIGGAGQDSLNDSNLSLSGGLNVIGDTESTQLNGYPVAGSLDATQNGGRDVTVLTIDPALTSAPSLSGFYGGSDSEYGESITTDADGNIYIVGGTGSNETTFPVLDGPDLTYEGSFKGFMAKMTSAGELVFSGYLGGEGDDYGQGVVLDSTGGIWTMNVTSSTVTFPNGYGFYSLPGFDQTFGGTYDNSLIRVSEVPAGVTIVESGGSTDINEAGPTSDDYTVVLESQPMFPVTVVVSPNAQQTTDEVSLTFTGLNWDVPQLVNTTAVQDASPECPHTGLILHTAESADLNYDGIAVASVAPNITDVGCSTPAIIVTESGGSTNINEAGPTSDDYTVVLTAQPSADVIVSIAPNIQQVTSLSSLTFTPSNWNSPQQVSTTAVDDTLVECPHTGLITHSAASADPAYNGIAVASVAPIITDNDCHILGGTNAKDIAIEVSRTRFANQGAKSVVIGREDIMSDTFVGTSFANRVGAPILLTSTTQLYPEVLAEIQRVLPLGQTVYPLGRELALNESVLDTIRNAGYNVERIGGQDRNETATLIAAKVALHNLNTTNKVFLSENSRLVDSLVISAQAANLALDNHVEPVLLTERDEQTMNSFTQQYLSSHSEITTVEIIGGTQAVSQAVQDALLIDFPHITQVTRRSGNTRYDTAATIASTYNPQPTTIVIASGERAAIPGAASVGATTQAEPLFATLLAGGLAAGENGPLLITQQNQLPAVIANYISAHSGTIGNLFVVGANTQVSQAVIDAVLAIL
jgi:putative cell wall-binding protein